MARASASEVAEKWANRLSGATAEITKGVNAVTESPTAKAAAKQQKMLQNLTQAVNSGKWASRLQSVTLADWKKATIEKGVNRIPGGAQAAKGKMQAFMSQLLPYQESLQSQIENMPDLTLEDSIARMTAWVRGMSQFERS